MIRDRSLPSSITPEPIVSDARQLLSLLIVKGQTEQTTWVTYITQRGPTFLVREARFGYTVPVITQPLAQFLARQGLLINAVFATAGVRDAFMTLVGVISVDPTGVAAKQLPLPFGGTCMADWWKFPQSEAALRLFNVRTDVPIFCNGVQVRHDICPVVWTMPHPSWCPCQWADTEKELYLGSLLVKSFIISPRAVYTVGTRFPPLLDYLRSRQPQIHVPEECLLHGPLRVLSVTPTTLPVSLHVVGRHASDAPPSPPPPPPSTPTLDESAGPTRPPPNEWSETDEPPPPPPRSPLCESGDTQVTPPPPPPLPPPSTPTLDESAGPTRPPPDESAETDEPPRPRPGPRYASRATCK
ncbi:hypothetical protein PAPYR_7600 [Paratrimastix pyriformis]|uniref:Uncharacterized protein n=1 Tax=Paratrimastix pyriformis TaxID=342808 RepID=A0ABQ8UCR7_9EUKA|nr:hypothetical protein PAPYR_7600 [Paratrimastix pyriformis]